MKRLLFASLATPAVSLAGPIDDALALLDAHAAHPPPALSASDRANLGRGESVALTLGTDAVAGLRVVNTPMTQVWAAVHNPAVTGDPSVRELRLAAESNGTELWYGRMKLPSPLSDRQWVVRSTIHTALHSLTEGRAWERDWVEVDDGLHLARPALSASHLEGLGAESLESAVTTPTNRGAWIVADLGGGKTLVVTHAQTDLGGSVPTWLVRDVARRQVKGLLDRVARDARWTHPDVVSGSGR
ncbi:MAG: hypothetical protein AB8H79_23540 [Myxococcota bacterium]